MARQVNRINSFKDLGPVVQKVDSAIHWTNHYPVDNAIGLCTTYPLDSDLSGGWHYPPFEQPGPDRMNCEHQIIIYKNEKSTTVLAAYQFIYSLLDYYRVNRKTKTISTNK